MANLTSYSRSIAYAVQESNVSFQICVTAALTSAILRRNLMVNKLLGKAILIGILALVLLIALSALNLASAPQSVQAQLALKMTTNVQSPHSPSLESVLGSPRLSPAFMNNVLESYHSPARGKGQILYDLGQRYRISSDVALAFFGHESTFGTSGVARFSLSLGNMRCLGRDYQDLHTWCEASYAFFDTWEHGFEAWFRLIRTLYVDGWGRTTFTQIIPKYAPQADHNDEKSYVRDLIRFLTIWYEGKVQP
jgi:hypothetical protein